MPPARRARPLVKGAAPLGLALVTTAASLGVMPGCGGPPPAGRHAVAPAGDARPPLDAPRGPVPAPPDPLDVSPAAEAFARAPRLPAKIARTPYAYFRFVNAAFCQIVCDELGDFSGHAPVVPLHGDAHLEQYALTDIGRGLSDFDDAATGPAVIDLARMATSLVLAARLRSFPDEAPLRAFVDGYRAGLRGESAPRPSITSLLAARFRDSPAKFLGHADELMMPEDADPTLGGDEMRLTILSLEREARAVEPEMPGDFFHVKQIGTLRAGIGSALERKFLARVEGPSAARDDDRIVEVKFVGDRRRPSCMRSRYDFDQHDLREDIPPRALDRFMEPTFIRDKNAWAQEWYPNFHEVEVEDVPSAEALAEIARDAGALLAREHVRGASPESLAIDPARETRLLGASRSLADRVEGAWRRFRSQIEPPTARSARPRTDPRTPPE